MGALSERSRLTMQRLHKDNTRCPLCRVRIYRKQARWRGGRIRWVWKFLRIGTVLCKGFCIDCGADMMPGEGRTREEAHMDLSRKVQEMSESPVPPMVGSW